MDKISIVIPCFNEEEAILVYYMEMKKIMKKIVNERSLLVKY